MRVRHKTKKRDLILKRYEMKIEAYEYLKNFLHENLPEVYDSIACDDGQIVLEEYIEGISASDVAGEYTYQGAKKVVTGVCKAVMALHKQRIIHRDIKPENILITKYGTVKLIDLNASRIPRGAEKDTVMLGTIGYASPEQLGVSESDERSDIYAIGVLFNVLLTGEHPSRNLAKGRAGRVVQKCTNIDPQSRYATVKDLMLAL